MIVLSRCPFRKQLTLGKYLLCKAPKVSSRACSLSAFSEQALPCLSLWSRPQREYEQHVPWIRMCSQFGDSEQCSKKPFSCPSTCHLNPSPLRTVPLVFQKYLGPHQVLQFHLAHCLGFFLNHSYWEIQGGKIKNLCLKVKLTQAQTLDWPLPR